MNTPLPEGRKKKPYKPPAFEVFHSPTPPAASTRTVWGRLRKKLGQVVRSICSPSSSAWEQRIELAFEIRAFARMRAIGSGDVLLEVPEVACRLRESPRRVRQSLRLLEANGIAEKTPSKDHWRVAA